MSSIHLAGKRFIDRRRLGRALGFELLEDRSLLTGGGLDATFGQDGKVITDFPLSGQDVGRAAAVQGDGKIVVAGLAGNAFAVARYHADGSLDRSFGSSGTVTTPRAVDFFFPKQGSRLGFKRTGRSSWPRLCWAPATRKTSAWCATTPMEA